MPRKTPIGKLTHVALGTIKDPAGAVGKAAGRAVGQARDSVALGRTVAGHVSKGATAAVLSRLPGHRHEPTAATTAPPASAEAQPAAPPRHRPAEESLKDQGDALAMPTTPPAGKEAAAKKATAKKTAAKKTAAKKTAAKKTAPEVQATPADVAKKVAKKAPATKAPAQKAPAQKATTRKSAPGGKLPAKKSPARKAAPKKGAATKVPLSAAELAAGAGPETITPVGTRGAGVATNPDTTETDLQQPGTEPIMDPATTKAVASEAATMRKASDTDKS